MILEGQVEVSQAKKKNKDIWGRGSRLSEDPWLQVPEVEMKWEFNIWRPALSIQRLVA